jgi:hypothetical protein
MLGMWKRIFHQKANEFLGLIEYNGIQHYEIIEFFGGEDGFRKSQQRDTIKMKYCKDNNIPLLIIPYTETDLQTTITNFLQIVIN